MSGEIAALCRLLKETIEDLRTPRLPLSPTQRRFLDVVGPHYDTFRQLRADAHEEMAAAARRVMRGDDLRQSPERGGTGPGSS